MPSYKAPVDDTLFLLNDVLNFQRFGNLPGFADVTPDVLSQILLEGGKICEEALAPLNQIGDEKGCKRHDDASVSTPPGFKAAHDAFAQGGWISLAVPEEYGGQGLPYTLSMAMNEFASSANMSFAMYPGLDAGRARRSAAPWRRRAEEALCAEDGGRPLVGHDESDRAAMRHRSRTADDQGVAARRRLLFDHRAKDLHLRRRARSDRKHRASRARAHRGRARRRERNFALRRAEVPGRRRRRAWTRATASAAAPSKKRWAFTATPPAS